MSKEILLLAEALASEKNVSNEIVFEALEVALGIAAKKKADREQMDLEIRIDRETGDYKPSANGSSWKTWITPIPSWKNH